jgi:hypothetical protein
MVDCASVSIFRSVGRTHRKQRLDGRATLRGKRMERLGRNREETIILFSLIAWK